MKQEGLQRIGTVGVLEIYALAYGEELRLARYTEAQLETLRVRVPECQRCGVEPVTAMLTGVGAHINYWGDTCVTEVMTREAAKYNAYVEQEAYRERVQAAYDSARARGLDHNKASWKAVSVLMEGEGRKPFWETVRYVEQAAWRFEKQQKEQAS